LIQLRTGHVALAQHLNHIKKNDNPNCPHCRLRGRNELETVRHFILDCPSYSRERFCMQRELGWDASSLKILLGDEKGMKTLLRYIGQTRRLEKSFGDV
ncbi:hypothetical protein BT96DRAFT_758208, partial [Gymnopus androsaceus JB14]